MMTLLLKFYWLTFEKNLKTLAALGRCRVTISRQGVNAGGKRELVMFKDFGAYLRVFNVLTFAGKKGLKVPILANL